MCDTPRRHFLARLAGGGFVLTPLAALLSACGKSGWPEGMAEIKWDRDTCVRCRMAVSDRRFAAQVRGGPKDQFFKFDDIGCVVFWLKEQPWGNDASIRMWVADAASRPDQLIWLDPRQARYVAGKTSPMGYNFAAYAQAPADSLAFAEMRELLLQKGK
jgi:copper chaperone NosL